MERLILDHLAELYNIKDRREGIHLSDIVYCLTKSFFNHKQMIEPTDEEIMLFVIGLGLQDILTPKEAIVPMYEKDGITFSPDFRLKIGKSEFHELKTARLSMKTLLESLPETWLEYIKGGCFMRGVTSYELTVLLLMGTYAPPFPKLYSETLVFEEQELSDNWNEIVARKAVFDKALATNKPPTPGIWCKGWECPLIPTKKSWSCRYSMQCSAIQMLEGFDDTEIDPQELKHE